MRRALIALGALIAGIGWSAAMILMTDRALPYHFPRGVEACFGRVYGDAFLQAHPTHRVTELYVFRGFSSGPLGQGDPRPRAQQIAADRASSGGLPVTVLARFRDSRGAYDRGVTCADGPVGASCFSDCEGANFDMHPDGRGLVLDRNSSIGFLHLNGGGESAGSSAWLRLKTDGVDYRLDPMPIASCLAAYDGAARAD
jgi:hypothetical protein